MQEPSTVPDVAKPVITKDTSVGSANGKSGTGRQRSESTKSERIESDHIQSTLDHSQQLRKTSEQFITLLRDISPVLFTIEAYNQKFLKDMEYGEIHIIQYVRNGRVYKVDGYPRISKMIE